MTDFKTQDKVTTLNLIADEIQTLVISEGKLQSVVLKLNGGTEDVREEFYEFLASNDGGISFNRNEVNYPDFPFVERALKVIDCIAPQIFNKIQIDIDYMDFMDD